MQDITYQDMGAISPPKWKLLYCTTPTFKELHVITYLCTELNVAFARSRIQDTNTRPILQCSINKINGSAQKNVNHTHYHHNLNPFSNEKIVRVLLASRPALT